MNVSQASAKNQLRSKKGFAFALIILSTFAQPSLAQFTSAGSASNPPSTPIPAPTSTPPGSPSATPSPGPVSVATFMAPSAATIPTNISKIQIAPSFNLNGAVPEFPRGLAPSLNTLIPTNLQTHTSEAQPGKNAATSNESQSIEWNVTYRDGSKAQFNLKKNQAALEPTATTAQQDSSSNVIGKTNSKSQKADAEMQESLAKKEKGELLTERDKELIKEYWQNLLTEAEEKKQNGSTNPFYNPDMLKLSQRNENGESLSQTEKNMLKEWSDKCAEFLSNETAKPVKRVTANADKTFDELNKLLEKEKSLDEATTPDEKINRNHSDAVNELNKLLEQEREK